ncbi:hypothetical protein INR49_028397 [Caranx melampygus]|nr:hypothetical protein INR49_028397 [Caranx melampygus]
MVWHSSLPHPVDEGLDVPETIDSSKLQQSLSVPFQEPAPSPQGSVEISSDSPPLTHSHHRTDKHSAKPVLLHSPEDTQDRADKDDKEPQRSELLRGTGRPEDRRTDTQRVHCFSALFPVRSTRLWTASPNASSSADITDENI